MHLILHCLNWFILPRFTGCLAGSGAAQTWLSSRTTWKAVKDNSAGSVASFRLMNGMSGVGLENSISRFLSSSLLSLGVDWGKEEWMKGTHCASPGLNVSVLIFIKQKLEIVEKGPCGLSGCIPLFMSFLRKGILETGPYTHMCTSA